MEHVAGLEEYGCRDPTFELGNLKISDIFGPNIMFLLMSGKRFRNAVTEVVIHRQDVHHNESGQRMNHV
jgi:glucose-6-phosphate 1-dehydrogenase